MNLATVNAHIDPRVTDFLAQLHRLLIDGRWVDAASGKTFPSFNPATGDVLACVVEGKRADVDRAIRAACPRSRADPGVR